MPPVSQWRIVVTGFGVAGSVLGAVIAAFAVASVVVTFSVWPEDPVRVTSPTYTLDPPSAARRQPSEPAFVLPAAAPAPAPAAARGSSAPAARAPANGAPAPRRRSRPTASGAARGAFQSGAPAAASAEQARPGRPAMLAPPPQEDGLGQVGGVVEDTTATLAHSLRSITHALGEQLAPVSPVLGDTVAGLGIGLGGAVDDAGRLVAALLGHPPQAPAGVQRPGPSR